MSEVAGAKLPEALDEAGVAAELARLATQNAVRTSMIGQGFYDTVTPAVIRRGILKIPPGTPPIRRTSQKSRRDGWRRYSPPKRW